MDYRLIVLEDSKEQTITIRYRSSAKDCAFGGWKNLVIPSAMLKEEEGQLEALADAIKVYIKQHNIEK